MHIHRKHSEVDHVVKVAKTQPTMNLAVKYGHWLNLVAESGFKIWLLNLITSRKLNFTSTSHLRDAIPILDLVAITSPKIVDQECRKSLVAESESRASQVHQNILALDL